MNYYRTAAIWLFLMPIVHLAFGLLGVLALGQPISFAPIPHQHPLEESAYYAAYWVPAALFACAASLHERR